MREFFVEFAAIVAMVLVVVALQKIFEYIFSRKMDE